MPYRLYEDRPRRMTDLLVSDDPYLRERTAATYATLATQAAGRSAIMSNLGTLLNLSRGLEDHLAAVRLQTARVLQELVQDYCGEALTW